MRGGARPGSGPQKGAKYRPRASKDAKVVKKKRKIIPPTTKSIPKDIQEDAANANMTPLDYMLKVMRDETQDIARRDRMAQAAAPFVHPRPGVKEGKKGEQANKATEAGKGRFAPAAAPMRLVK